MIGVFENNLEAWTAHLRIVLRHEDFSITFDGGQRRAQFMGGIGDKIAPYCFEPFQLRDIVEGYDRPEFALRLLYTDYVNMVEPIGPKGNLAVKGMDFVFQDSVTGRLEFRASDHLEGSAAFEFRNRGEHAPGCAVR